MLRHSGQKASLAIARIHGSTRSFGAVPLESTRSLEDPQTTTNPVPNFHDTQSAYQSKSTTELIRAAACFRLCKIPLLVSNAERLLRMSRKISPVATDALLKASLYGHFCAGEDQTRIQPVVQKLDDYGVGNILDYAAENDDPVSVSPTSTTPNQLNSPVAREYDYESEAQCDKHVNTFMQCITDVAAGGKDGYAAIKVTALGNPKLLFRMSQAMTEVKALFEKFDMNGDGFVTRDEFEVGYKQFFRDIGRDINDIFDEFDPDHTGQIDYITWSMMLEPKDLPRITSACKDIGPLAMATPTEEEIELIDAMYTRGHALANEASKVGTRLLIDAEQIRYQPAIDKLVLDLQRTFNVTNSSNKPVIYNTYQCYLKDAPERLHTDVMRSERFGYHFGAKLVRGAYMESEIQLAAEMGMPRPIHDSLNDTHTHYDKSVDFLLSHSTSTDKSVEIMCATHNQASIENAIQAMNKYNIDRKSSTICFAQLYGMSDHLSFNLGKHGYRAYKYLPYGEVSEVMPYLLRRANENSAIVGATSSELAMIKEELRRRMQIGFGLV